MDDKNNYLRNAELATEQNDSMIDGILGNNTAPPPPEPEEKPKDRVLQPPRKKRSREREDR